MVKVRQWARRSLNIFIDLICIFISYIYTLLNIIQVYLILLKITQYYLKLCNITQDYPILLKITQNLASTFKGLNRRVKALCKNYQFSLVKLTV